MVGKVVKAMKHEIQLEEYTRESDGHRFARVIMSDLAGSDSFEIVCTADSAQEALLQLAHRLRLISRDARDIAGRIFDKHWMLDVKANCSLYEGYSGLQLVEDEEDLVREGGGLC